MLAATCLSMFIFQFPLAQGAKHCTKIKSFVWIYGNSDLGTLRVPTGFRAETENYREGIVTRLRYPDGSYLMFQKGGMYRVPMFQDPQDILDFSKVEDATTIRRGHYRGGRCWGEVNYSPVNAGASGKSFLSLFPPNLGYANVPCKRADEFFEALRSFRYPD